MEEEEPAVTESVPHTRQLCRFFSQGRHCNFGERCRFQHVRDNANKANGRPTLPEITPSHLVGPGCDVDLRGPNTKPRSARRPCRYFLSGFCSMEDRCRFWHPPQFTQFDDKPAPRTYTQPAQRRPPPVPHPLNLQEVKLCDLTEDVTKQLRDTEIRQMKKRFPKDQLIVQERSDGLVTYYRATVEATDPDWPFDLKDIDVMISFPDNYPQEIFTLDIPLDQDLPPLMARYVQEASLKWLEAKHATNQLCGKVELLFRPFLRWLDRSMEKLFTEGARELKKEVDLEKAGLQFIPYQKLQTTAGGKAGSSESCDPAAADDDEGNEATEGTVEEGGHVVQQEGQGSDQEGEQEEEEEEEEAAAASHLVENIKISDPRRGTEVKLLGLRLGENTATVVAQQITVCLQCNRCKVTADLTLTGKTLCSAQCEKCSASISAGFRPCMLHHYSDVLGYLDLHNAAPVDLVLQDCELVVGCLSCSQDVPVEVMKRSLSVISGTFPTAKQRSSIAITATANSASWLTAQDSSIFSHVLIKQVRVLVHLIIRL
ncbi:uncharacterized protein LOC142992155 isoform X3 [Genypterus blacodes]|uniref:uncharacterized protein LOC142992155 isoform X3 n=1 Tax=Genypterus blacodes TaxID=154954 RepID=UPI003F75B1F1